MAWINLMCVQAARITLDHLFGSINLPHLFSSTGIHELKLHIAILLSSYPTTLLLYINKQKTIKVVSLIIYFQVS